MEAGQSRWARPGSNAPARARSALAFALLYFFVSGCLAKRTLTEGALRSVSSTSDQPATRNLSECRYGSDTGAWLGTKPSGDPAGGRWGRASTPRHAYHAYGVCKRRNPHNATRNAQRATRNAQRATRNAQRNATRHRRLEVAAAGPAVRVAESAGRPGLQQEAPPGPQAPRGG